jgi:hypothetical protein
MNRQQSKYYHTYCSISGLLVQPLSTKYKPREGYREQAFLNFDQVFSNTCFIRNLHVIMSSQTSLNCVPGASSIIIYSAPTVLVVVAFHA